jgi:DNA-directed RNA polymerase subunit RPC12/RpoP
MCIGLFKNAGKGVPTKETLKYCFETNRDGAGYAYLTTDNTWAVKKGLMTWDTFWAAWEAENFTDKHTVVAHFRIGTSGRCPGKAGEFGKGELCTHPFPISDVTAELEKLEYEAEQIVLHNGVVGKGEGFLSDTMVAIKDHIAVLAPYAWEDPKVASLLEDLIDCGPRYQGSRWLVANGNQVQMLGTWEEDKTTGCMYTHTGYKPWPVYHGTGHKNWWNQYGAFGTYGDEETWEQAGTADSRSSRGNWKWEDGRWQLKDSSSEPKFAYFPNDSLAETFQDGKFSWDEWNTWLVLLDADLTSKEDDDDDDGAPEELYDANGTSILALVDKFGNIIWDDVTRQDTIEVFNSEVYHCRKCGAANMSADDIEHDDDMNKLCPYCYSFIMPWLEHDKDEADDTECPSCGEKRHIGTPTLDKGDTQCYRCGAIYLNTIKGMDGIVCWDEEIRQLHNEMVGGKEDK